MPAPSDILSDPDISKAYEDVRSDKSETTWLVLKYESATKDILKLAASGTGDIAEMVETLGDDEAAYGYVRMKLGNDEYSERVKFAFVVWAGEWIAICVTETIFFSFCKMYIVRGDRSSAWSFFRGAEKLIEFYRT